MEISWNLKELRNQLYDKHCPKDGVNCFKKIYAKCIIMALLMCISPSFFTNNQTRNLVWVCKLFFIFIWVAGFCYCNSCGQNHYNFNNKEKENATLA